MVILIILMILALIAWSAFLDYECSIIIPLTINVMQVVYIIYLLIK